ncbi:hypothetical protein NPIL_279691 [Nephila pilipes]|uniref:Uncharacterized protein n=1 Tax=Nephila pilipes TaxID=299642 RepID=A0A8X6TA61_NEPPI|nr:hypothetical protein NPIL_279691 [Nephila pilipes]
MSSPQLILPSDTTMSGRNEERQADCFMSIPDSSSDNMYTNSEPDNDKSRCNRIALTGKLQFYDAEEFIFEIRLTTVIGKVQAAPTAFSNLKMVS